LHECFAREIPSKREKKEKVEGETMLKALFIHPPSNPQDKTYLISFLNATKMLFIFYLRDLLSSFAPLLVISMAALLLVATSQFDHREFEVEIDEQVQELAHFVFGPDAESVHQPRQHVIQSFDHG
jgi:hypothetical protein